MRTVSQDARHLMLYLLTCPHRNIMGLYYLPAPYACHDLEWVPKRFGQALGELLANGRVKYDSAAEVIFIANYLKHNPLENPNQVTSAIARLNELPQTPLMQELLTVLEGFGKPYLKPLVERLQERLGERFGKPVTVTVTVTESGSNKHVSSGKPDDTGVVTSKVSKEPFLADFEECWKHYPRKREKKAAYRQYVARRRKGFTAEELLRATKTYALEVAGRTPDKIKHGSTFFGRDQPFEDYLKDELEDKVPEPENLVERLERLVAEDARRKEAEPYDDDDGGLPF